MFLVVAANKSAHSKSCNRVWCVEVDGQKKIIGILAMNRNQFYKKFASSKRSPHDRSWSIYTKDHPSQMGLLKSLDINNFGGETIYKIPSPSEFQTTINDLIKSGNLDNNPCQYF